jgi:HEPN domain-containing protein
VLAAHDNHYAAYHCQQAAGKLIRVLLLHHDIEPGLDHHLDVLVGKLPEDEPRKTKLAAVHKYTPYATTCRQATPSGRVLTSPEAEVVAADAARMSALIADARRQLASD